MFLKFYFQVKFLPAKVLSFPRKEKLAKKDHETLQTLKQKVNNTFSFFAILVVKFKEKRAESCHAQMSTFFGTLINKMQPSVDKMFVTPQRQAWKGLLPKSPGCQEKKFHFCEFPLVSRKRTTAEEQLADSSLGTSFHQGR